MAVADREKSPAAGRIVRHATRVSTDEIPRDAAVDRGDWQTACVRGRAVIASMPIPMSDRSTPGRGRSRTRSDRGADLLANDRPQAWVPTVRQPTSGRAHEDARCPRSFAVTRGLHVTRTIIGSARVPPNEPTGTPASASSARRRRARARRSPGAAAGRIGSPAASSSTGLQSSRRCRGGPVALLPARGSDTPQTRIRSSPRHVELGAR